MAMAMYRETETPDYCFNILEELGKGCYGTVWKAMDTKTDKFCAIKILNENYSNEQDMWNLAEVECLLKLRHPNIIGMQRVIWHNTLCHLVFDLMDCDLSKLIIRRGRVRSFSEDEIRSICSQIFQGLARLHNEGYCHRDLKLENILVSGEVIKISDFGEATKITGAPQESYVVTRPYGAPELFLGSTHYDFAIDMWAMGTIMVELITGCKLFPVEGFCVSSLLYKICSVIGTPDNKSWPYGVGLAYRGNYALPEEFMKVDSTTQLFSLIPRASREAISLINSLLSWDPKKRPTAEAALQHPFFQGVSVHTK